MPVVQSLNEVLDNIERFQAVSDPANWNSIAHTRFSTFKSWYFVDSYGFGPSKFIGYKNTSVASYTGAGNGYITNKGLEPFFEKLDPNSHDYQLLHNRLKSFAQQVQKKLSQKLYTSGGIYVLKKDRNNALHTPDEETAPIITGEGEAQIKVRHGQGEFRDRLRKEADKCWMSGITDLSLLIASHIKPWSHCNSSIPDRGDVNNGLLLSALWDAAFDGGLITFDESWRVIPSDELSKAARDALDLANHTELPAAFRNEKRALYMQHHRANCFKGGEK